MDFVVNRHETVVQIVFSLRFISGILQANAKQDGGIRSIEFRLRCALAFLALSYELLLRQGIGWISEGLPGGSV